MAASGPRPFTVGGTVRRTFATLGRDLPAFVGLALALSLLPQLLGIGLSFALESRAALPALAGAMMALSVVHRGAAVGLALPAVDGGRRTFASALKGGAALFLRNAWILILVWLGVGLGSLLLVVPGAMLMCRWIVAVPAEVAERPGVRGALERSRDLTAGHRWRVFGLLAIYSGPAAIWLLLLLFQDPAGSPSDKAVVAVMAAVVGTAVGMVGNVGLAAIYAELRAAREGAEPAEIAEAFG